MEDKYNYYNRLIEKHGNIYEFNKETIKTSRDKVEFKCKKCNSINSTKLNTLLMSKPRNSCPNCSIVSKGTRETKEEKINKLKEKFPNLDFSKFIYTKGDQKSIVICPIHGEFEVRYRDLLRKMKYGCIECSKSRNFNKLTQDEAINRMKEVFPQFDYSRFVYKGAMIKSIIICPEHGEFQKSYDYIMSAKRNHIKGKVHGCPKCAKSGFSSYEKEIVEYIKTFYNYKIEENTYSVIKNEFTNKWLELDIYLPDSKFAIEFNGKYWHSDNFKRIGFNSIEEYHNYKSKKCNELGIELLHIQEDNYLKNKEFVLSLIKNKINII